MKALRTIGLDCSDTFLFANAAQTGDWKDSGALVFASIDPSSLNGKAPAYFRSGFLGIDSPGWSTPVQIVEATEAGRARAVDVLAHHLTERFGAPNLAMARRAAEEEIDFAVSLADHPSAMLAAVSRMREGESKEESFRSLRPAADEPTSTYALLPASGEDEQPAEEVDLISLARRVAR